MPERGRCAAPFGDNANLKLKTCILYCRDGNLSRRSAAALEDFKMKKVYNGVYVAYGHSRKRPEAYDVGLFENGVPVGHFFGYVNMKRNIVKLYPAEWVTASFYSVHTISLHDLKTREEYEKIRNIEKRKEKSS